MTNDVAMIDEPEVERRQRMLGERLDTVRARMAAVGGHDVGLLPVSKGHPVEAAIAARRSGLMELGENYAQDLAAKAPIVTQCAGSVGWHFIGQLQTNKVRLIAEHVHTWQSVDRIKAGREIAKRAPGARVFAQVNLSTEQQKAGCSFDDIDELVAALYELELDVGGLMGVGSAADDSATAAGFAQLRGVVDRLELAECSMGMSTDLEMAIREGSTMVRIGSDLFGARI
jgi:pyridoxal phosphate enzyme (YggS family)